MPSLHDLPAPAKINLFLHITGRRPDGYHLLQSVFMLIDWQDTLHIDTRTDGHIRRHDLNVALPDDDLCLKAARLLRADLHYFHFVKIQITLLIFHQELAAYQELILV